MKKEEIKERLYNLMDSFLVEGDKPRSIERLNQDRHLFVKNVLDLLDQQKEELAEKIEFFERDMETRLHSEPFEIVKSGLEDIKQLLK